MNRMRKNPVIITLLVIMALTFGLTGCGNEPSADEKESVPVGTWIETTKVAEADDALHPVEYRITRIVRDQEVVEAAIESFNVSGEGFLVESLESDELEYCLAEYEVSFPEDFPQKDYGITNVTINFEVVALDGGIIETGGVRYQNIAETVEIGSTPKGYDFHAGDTYTGLIVFAMVKGYEDYLLKEIPSDENGTINYIRGE